MAASLTLELPNSREAIAPASAAAEAWLEQQGARPAVAYVFLLAIEELATNCIKYGYADGAKHTITIIFSADDGTVTMTTIDDGRPFDPLTAPLPDLDRPLAERSEGGLGLLLLRKCAGAIRYERREGTNRVTLTQRLD